jgi:hypothetical protein
MPALLLAFLHLQITFLRVRLDAFWTFVENPFKSRPKRIYLPIKTRPNQEFQRIQIEMGSTLSSEMSPPNQSQTSEVPKAPLQRPEPMQKSLSEKYFSTRYLDGAS